MNPTYLNGEWLAPADAKVSVMDRGFLFGDGVYELLPVYSRQPFRLDEHLARLQQSLDSIQLPNPHTPAQWRALVTRMAERADCEDQSIYLQVTRGPMAIRNHAFPPVVVPTVFMMAEPLLTPTPEQISAGVATVSAADIRWLRCDIKSVSMLANCLLRQFAVAQGCAETVLFRDGFLTEGSASSIFVVRGGVLLAPIKNHLMLPGITYDVVLELAAANGLPFEVRDITEGDTRNADELWMASSTKEVLPIATLDGKNIGTSTSAGTASSPKNGERWPIHTNMLAWYQAYKRDVMRAQK